MTGRHQALLGIVVAAPVFAAVAVVLIVALMGWSIATVALSTLVLLVTASVVAWATRAHART